MRYQKIESRIWHDEKFTSLTPQQQRLFFYILTSPHGNLIGLYVLKQGYVCEDLKSLPKDLRKDLGKLIEKGLIEYDFSMSVVWVKNFLKHNQITNPNQVKAAETTIKELPKTYLIQRLAGLIKGLTEGLIEGLSEVLPKPDSDSDSDSDFPLTPQKVDDRFNQFWLLYPRKVCKRKAEQIWNKLKVENGLFEKIVSSLKTQISSDQWQKDNGQYIPHPTTWLNGRRWEDEGPGKTKSWREG